MRPESQTRSTTVSEQRFLVTGAKGFIGAWIVAELIERGVWPLVFDIDPNSHRLKALLTEDQLRAVAFIQGDVTRFADVDRAISENGITVVFHLAGLRYRVALQTRFAAG